MQADMLAELADIAGVIQLVEQGTLPGGLPSVATRPFGSLVAINDSSELVLSVMLEAATIIQHLACLTPPVFHWGIFVGNLVYHGDDQSTVLIDSGTAVVAATGCISAVGPQSMTGTSTFLARSVLQGEGYTLSSELDYLMCVLGFLAVDGDVRWGNKSIGPAALHVKVAFFGEQESSEKYVLRHCPFDLMQAVIRLQRFFRQPTYQRSITPLQFHQALQPA